MTYTDNASAPIQSVLCYCRSGYESELAAELQEAAAQTGLLGYVKAQKNTGYSQFVLTGGACAKQVQSALSLSELVFARQLLCQYQQLQSLDTQDRIGQLLPHILPLGPFHDVVVEHPDTEQGKELAKFCRKFTVPLRQALKREKALLGKSSLRLHVFFTQTDSCHIAVAHKANSVAYPMGIMRLKSPPEAPSRSTLKLDEAFQLFIPKAEHEQRLSSGSQAVDLGACPGGWTYQLVRRGMHVQAVDNGDMHPDLMATGLVEHYAEDGFVYKPKRGPVSWLVCDMVEQPQRVATLMTSWVCKGWCRETIFNLKLPMKKRHVMVQQCLDGIREQLASAKIKQYQLQAKHLYHDRDEITVHLRRLTD